MDKYKIFSTRFGNSIKEIFVNNGNDISEEHKRVKELITDSIKRDNVIFLTAAGASKVIKSNDGKDCAPLMGDVFNEIQKDKDYAEVSKLVTYDDKQNNFEIFLSRCIFYLKLKEDKLVSDFLDRSKKIISHKCDFIDDTSDISIIEIFLRKLCSYRTNKNRPSIFTLNYDFSIERAASHLGVVLIDGFSFNFPFRFNPIFFDYDIIKKDDGYDIPIDNVIKFYKIHGSLNWTLENETVIKSHSKVDVPHIIFPSKEKFQNSYDQPFIEMINRFKDSLRKKSTTLFVVGYSCGDEHINSLIKNALQINFDLKLIYLNPTLEGTCSAYNKYVESYEDSRVTCIEINFENFCKSLMPEGRSSSKEEKLIKALMDVTKAKKHE